VVVSSPLPNGAILNSAFNVGGSHNDVVAGPGPLSIAGAINQTNQIISRTTPGFNINGNAFP
jgi:hypothetical protein